MRDPVNTKENNHRRNYTHVKSREFATTVVNMGTIVDILWKEKKTIPVCAAKVWTSCWRMLQQEEICSIMQVLLHEGSQRKGIPEETKGWKILRKGEV